MELHPDKKKQPTMQEKTNRREYVAIEGS